ncbi:MAG: RNA methyltransferase [Chloroflexota bacterium]
MITSRTNPLIKLARALRRGRARHETGLFLVEGLQQVGAAIEAGWDVETIIHAPELLASDFGRQVVSRFGGRLEEVSAPVFASIAEKEHPTGILAIAKQRRGSFGSTAPFGCGAALVCPQDPGNVGTVLRTLDAVGGSALYLLDGGVDAYHPTTIRASMGASFFIPVVEASFTEFLDWRGTHEIQLIGTSARAERNYREARPAAPWILLLGSEQKGLSESHRAACDIVVSLPMRGRASSLNLGVAAGVLLFAFTDG